MREFTKGENDFLSHNFSAAEYSLYSSAEFFWKSLTVLSGQNFRRNHDADEKDMTKISKGILSDIDQMEVLNILTHFPQSRRELATYGLYAEGTNPQSPLKGFNQTTVKQDYKRVKVLPFTNSSGPEEEHWWNKAYIRI